MVPLKLTTGGGAWRSRCCALWDRPGFFIDSTGIDVKAINNQLRRLAKVMDSETRPFKNAAPMGPAAEGAQRKAGKASIFACQEIPQLH